MMNVPRKPLLVLSLLLVLAMGCSALANFLETGEGEGTAPGTAPPEEGGVSASEQAPGAPAATEGPRRLELLPTPTPFHVVSEDDPRHILDLASPDHVDYFDEPDTWSRFETEGVAAYYMQDGHLVGLDAEPEERYIYWSFTFVQAGNTYAEVSTTNGDCIGKDSVGFVIRVDPETTPSGYALEVSCDGSWRFRRFRGNRTPEEFTEWLPSDLVNTGLGAVNRLGIWAYQGEFVPFINGVAVDEIQDADFPWAMGYFALYVRASQTFDLTATFDDFAFWHIPYQE
jgi:hypothetical protein